MTIPIKKYLTVTSGRTSSSPPPTRFLRFDFARIAIKSLADFCYPRTCIACKIAIDDSIEVGENFCGECGITLAKLESAPFCDLCSLPIPEPGAPCAHCRGAGVPHFEKILRIGIFEDPLKHLIHQMKYHRRWPIAEMLANRLLAHEPIKTLLSEIDVLIPVPLHAARQIQRGYNQADVIARTLSRACDIPVDQPLARIKRTPMQSQAISATQRVENMRDAFLLERSRSIAGKHIVLIDDVMTTGATLQSAARVIAKAKPASISAIVIAVADPKRRGFEVV